MIRFLFKKALILLISLWCVITSTFFLMHAIPGDPFIGDRVIPQEVLNSLYSHFGLDQPIWVQYLQYLKGILHGELGPSIIYQGRSVNQFIAEGFPISFQLGLQALCLAIPTGIFLGTMAAMHRGKWQDSLFMTLSTIGVSVPSFVLGSFFQFAFSLKLHLFPVARWGGFEHTILPTLALAALPTAFVARLTRSNMVEVLQQDYIQTALAKGIPLFRVSIQHGLRNAILPVITYLGPISAGVLTGSFIIEKIFAIPGLGQWMIHSINGRDYPMIMGLTVFFSTFLMVNVFLVDLLYTLLDPRIRLKKETYA
ncbi:MAG: peptide ABC transporter permease [Chlamydiae bacterium RIFCSPHIGHO2_12_FULL_44_59]|nr:MAG: peptide ABC transporter permease [Chlamydiae bacterium RIFCSPHIGHO2_01_FULL_44_39]OGN57302.1 MAG: peptide ABC transporter permease [Chlamydiae bacterium RIFCSPHIGHO2_02_FULL_45_9]OGN60798.1 MAG: peptide ABC transporter permease [Chlamydiae bacterium RIFCSPHIGHO2_12_FULL_44_59]OGN66674.1 MAG: peptide ABC transporter permease [Chlamydiae bacterium RIFCSPLOWO2_01_FULL_44_52]OGN67324.1 MAG: peptide ABC transporter permease [Chlamydiae bacterium RIFCSPLOWO2_02_FULL_45_22]OGN70599.1 MAG: pep